MAKNMLVVGVAFLLGCASVAPLNTPSGGPEFTYNAPREKVGDILGAWMVEMGFSLEDHSERMIRGRKSAGNTVNILLGPSDTILTITMVNVDDGKKARAMANIQL